MHPRRTFTCNKDVIPAGAASSTTPWCRSLGLAVALFTLLMLTGPGLVAQPYVGSDDNLTAEERSTIQDEISQTTRGIARYRGIVVVDTTVRNAVFGLRAHWNEIPGVMQMLGRTIDWAIDHKDHSAARIWMLARTLDDYYALLVQEYLVDSMGFNPDSIHIALLSTLETGDFTGYDLVLQTYAIPPIYDPTNVLNQGVPFVTVSVLQAEAMGLASNDDYFSEHTDMVWIQDTDHEITSPWEPGSWDIGRITWADAFYVGGNGVALVTVDSSYHHPLVKCEIQKRGGIEFGSTVTIDVFLASGSWWFDMAGFDLLLGYDTSLLELVSISQGELLDRCGWEYFDYRVGPEADCAGQACPEGMIRLVGVADLASVPGSPSCNADSDGTVSQIEFLVSSDSADECEAGHIMFWWYDCGDNVFSSVSGDSLYISYQWDDDETFPTPWGSPAECITDSSTIFRDVRFYNGYVQLECAPPPPPPPEGVGDVNLNGVGFEIADWVLFTNYFWYGLDVFNVNYYGQIAASDVNLDGVPLTLQDLVYMYYYIWDGHDVPHHPPDPGDTVFFSQDTVAKTVSLSYPDSLSVVYMVFDGDLEPWGESYLDLDSQYTRVLIGSGNWPWDDSTIFEQDSLFFYVGEGTLVAAYATYDGYTPIPTAIVDAAGDCCLNKGNIDNDPSGELNIADLVYLIEYMFEDGPEPPCGREADVIEDWSIDLADLVFLIDYMFNGGPPAPPCP